MSLSIPSAMAYRNAIIIKKLLSMAFNLYGLDWAAFLKRVDTGFAETVKFMISPAD